MSGTRPLKPSEDDEMRRKASQRCKRSQIQTQSTRVRMIFLLRPRGAKGGKTSSYLAHVFGRLLAHLLDSLYNARGRFPFAELSAQAGQGDQGGLLGRGW